MIKVLQRSTSSGVVVAGMHKLFKTIETELEEPLPGKVIGTIPTWVNGSLYRNGPGMYEVGEHKFKHWFDGMALLQRFHISNGNVTYQRKYLQSDAYVNNMKANRIATGEFGTAPVPDPCKNVFQRFLTIFESHELTDNTGVNFVEFNNDLYATTETLFMNKINPDTLDRVEKVNLEEKVGVNLASAHPHVDSDGNMYNIGHSFKRGLFTVLVAIPPQKDDEEGFPKGEIVYKVRSPWKVNFNYYHSFSMTENYFVFVQQPLLSSVPKIMLGRLTGSPYVSSLQYYPDIKNRFRIVDKRTGQEVNEDCVYESDSFFYFHQINAYEEQGHIIVDISCHKNHDVMERLYMKNLSSQQSEEAIRSTNEPEVRRYVLPLDVKGKEPENGDYVTVAHTTSKCRQVGDKAFHLEAEILADIGIELPQINYKKHNGKKYRYMYGVAQHHNENLLFSIAKIDANTKKFVEWKEERCYPSEPVFIPKPDGDAEDDGVLIAAVNRSSEGDIANTCFLLVLDAKSFKEMARVEFEGVDRFPRDIHGLYTSDKI